MKQLRAFSIIALVLGSAGIASGQTSYTWALPQDGVWGIPENWSPANVPDATAEAAILNGPGPYTVSLFQHLGGISSLTIEDSAVSLAIESGGHLGVGWMLNNGLIRMKAESGSTPARLYFYVGLTLSGDGELRMEGDVLRPTIGSEVPFTNVAPHRITGAGVIDAGFVNDSLMSANLPGKRLSLLSSINTNNSVMQAENSGILEFDNCYVGQGPDGVIRADGGDVQFIGSPIIYHGRLESTNGAFMANTSNLTLDNVACAADIYAGRILYKGPILQNAGVIRVTAGARFLQFSESTTLTGGGEMRLANGTVGTTGTPLPVTITQEPDHRLFGSGTIGVSFINNGLIEADQSFQSLRFLGQPLVNNGVIRATNGGVFERAFGGASGAGEWIADGGTIKGTSSQPDVNLIGPTRVIHGGFLGAFGLGGWSASDLTIDATSSMHVTARLALSGNYLFEQADESKITWNAGANLIMSGGSGASCSSASWATLEVGGSDDGVGGNGTGNFGMENIIVTENAAVALSDFADNGNRGGLSGTAEALYATSLTLEAGAILNLNGLHIYVGGVERDPGPFGDGLIVDEPIHRAGDMNCDGSLNGLDVAAFVVAALTPGDYPTQFPNCNLCTGDLDGDGQSATIEDIPLFVDALLIAQAL